MSEFEQLVGQLKAARTAFSQSGEVVQVEIPEYNVIVNAVKAGKQAGMTHRQLRDAITSPEDADIKLFEPTDGVGVGLQITGSSQR